MELYYSPKDNKKLSLHPLNFEEALKGLLETEPPKEKQERRHPQNDANAQLRRARHNSRE